MQMIEEAEIVLNSDTKKLTINPNCSFAELVLFGAIITFLLEQYPMHYLEKHPDIVVKKYNKAIFDMRDQLSKCQ